MTKEGIEEIIRRYSNIERYVKDGETVASFYIGNRKQTVMITEAVRTVYRIVDEIYEREDKWMRIMIDGLKKGMTDRMLIRRLPWEKNAYYDRKHRFIEKIYNCCIFWKLVTYDEILNEGIGI